MRSFDFGRLVAAATGVDEGFQSRALSRPSVLESDEKVPLEYFPEYTYEAKAGTRDFRSNVKTTEEREIPPHLRSGEEDSSLPEALDCETGRHPLLLQSISPGRNFLCFSTAELKRPAMEVSDNNKKTHQNFPP